MSADLEAPAANPTTAVETATPKVEMTEAPAAEVKATEATPEVKDTKAATEVNGTETPSARIAGLKVDTEAKHGKDVDAEAAGGSRKDKRSSEYLSNTR